MHKRKFRELNSRSKPSIHTSFKVTLEKRMEYLYPYKGNISNEVSPKVLNMKYTGVRVSGLTAQNIVESKPFN